MDLSSASTQEVYVQVTADVGGVTYDPTDDAVSLAFMPNRVTPGGGDWQNATWQTINGINYAVCLVGPENGGVQLDVGTWSVWFSAVDNPEVSSEVPVIFAGYLNIK